MSNYKYHRAIGMAISNQINKKKKKKKKKKNKKKNFKISLFQFGLLSTSTKVSLTVQGRIYEYVRNLSYESYLHSFVINDVDKETKSLFQKEEWEEIFSFNLKKTPKVDKTVLNLMKKYSTTDLSLFREVIFKPFLPTGTSYSDKKHFDLNYINLAFCAIHTFWCCGNSNLWYVSEDYELIS